MTNIATLLKGEITRLARKEVRAEIAPLKKASASSRIEIAALKRQLKEVERALRQALKPNASSRAVPDASSQDAKFNARGMKAHRKKLGFSAKEYGLLVGASGLSIYKWEDEKVAPRAKFLPALAAARRLGKREALKQLSALTGTDQR